MSLPVPVTRTRLLVPLWVLFFGMSSVLVVSSGAPPPGAGRADSRAPRVSVRSCGLRPSCRAPPRACERWGREGPSSGLRRGRILLAGVGLRLPATAALRVLLRLLVPVRSDHHDHVPAVLLGVGLHHPELGDVGRQPLQQPVAHLGPGLLATAEHHGDLDLVAALEEALDVALLGLVVVRVDLQAQPHLLDDGERLVAPGLAGLLRGLVLELPVVHELDDGWPGHGRDLDQVELAVLRQPQRLADRHDADLLTLGTDESDLGDADTVVDTGLGDGLSSAAAVRSLLAHPATDDKGPVSFCSRGPLAGRHTSAPPGGGARVVARAGRAGLRRPVT